MRPQLPEKELARGIAAAPQSRERAPGGTASRATPQHTPGSKPMSDLQAIADRVEIEALRGEYTDAVMTRGYDRVASLFTPDAALRMPNVPVELEGQQEIRAWGERVPALVDYFVQTTHLSTIQLEGDTAAPGSR